MVLVPAYSLLKQEQFQPAQAGFRSNNTTHHTNADRDKT